LRAATPSAAAELCAPSVESLADEVEQMRDAVRLLLEDRISVDAQLFEGITRRLVNCNPSPWLKAQYLDVARLQNAIGLVRSMALPALSVAATSAAEALERCRFTPIATRRTMVEGLASVLEALDSNRVLDRGYAMIQSDDTKRWVGSAGEVAPGNRITIFLHDGKFGANVVTVDPGMEIEHHGNG
jgi:exodeoxyribonuclease VII large subunit